MFLQAWSHFHQSIIYNFVLCVVLWKTPYLIYVTDSSTLNSQPITLYPMPKGSLPDMHISSASYITAFLHLENTRQHFSTMLSCDFKQHITNKHKTSKHIVLDRLWKGHLFIVLELKQESRESPCSTSTGTLCTDHSNFPPFLTCPQMTIKV